MKKNYEENRFHKARFEISKVCDELNVDYELGAYEYANRMGWDVGAGGAELEEYEAFTDHVRDIFRSTSGKEAHNAVYHYFHCEDERHE